MNISVKSILFTVAATASLAASTAFAARPDNIANTTWTVQANRDVEQLVITHQGGPGAPGAATCRVIVGTIGIAPIHGWFCPATGRIHFNHKNLDSGHTVRTFTGNVSDVSDDPRNETLCMSGTMAVVNAAFDDLGEYNFAATK